MQELPPDPIESQQNQDLPFAGLLSELLQQWDSAETSEKEPAAELAASEPEADAEAVDELPAEDSISAEMLLARFETPAEEEEVQPETFEDVALVSAVELPESSTPLPVNSLVCMDEAVTSLAAAEPEPECLPEAVVEPEPECLPEAVAEPESEPEPASEPELESEPEPVVAIAEAEAVSETASAPVIEGDGNLTALMASLEQEIQQSDSGAIPAPREDSARSRYITFTLGGSTYALELKHVIETDRIPSCTNVPGTPGFVRGVINLRGEVLALLELRELLDLGPSDQPGMERMLVVKTSNSDGPCGLIVDRLGGMALMDPNQLQPMPVDGSKVSLVLSGVGEHRGHLVNVLNLEELFAGSDIRELAGICI